MGSKIQWRIGCSGFHYREWMEMFYPIGTPQRKWFEYYCTRFDTLELNFTFYRFPQLVFLENWYDKSPGHFNFAVKAPRLITHYRQFTDIRPLLDDFYGVLKEGLKEKLGPVLFQFHPNMPFSESKLHEITDQLDPSLMNVVEFRDSSWWREDVYKKLAAHKISFCGMSHPKLPNEPVCNTNTPYYRFHGVPVLYKSEYQEEFMDTVSESILENKKVKEAYLYFNNTAKGAAIRNALYLQEKLQPLHTVKAPKS